MVNPLFDGLFGRHDNNHKTFLYQADGQTVSYDAFLKRASQFANALSKLGVKTGDRVVVQVEKCPDNLAIYAACVQSGAVFLPLNTAYTPPEVEYFVNDSGATVLVCAPHNAHALAAIADQAGCRLETLGADQTGSLAELADQASTSFAPVARSLNDLAAILYTSGTTGRSKGAMLSQNNLLSNAQVLTDHWRFTDQDVLLHALPIFHTHGLFVATNITLIAGGSMVFLPKLDIDQLIEWMPTATTMMGVPTFYTRLLNDVRLDRKLTAGMRLFVSGSAPLLAETHKEFEERTGHRILERYGMTETNMTTSNPYDGDRRAGTVGQPLAGIEARVCDDEGVELPHGEIGILEVRGGNVFQGYWQMPEKTQQELRPNGFFITGDLASKSADGYVTIVGRGKDLIISGGFNIYPREVEELIDAQPGVLESAVISAPHADLGEAPVAIVVPKDGAQLETGDIDWALANNLARFKRPRHYVIAESLPRNTMGKVQKAQLREMHKSVFSDE